MKLIAVIPARYNSSRMPGKPLADIEGKPMIWWVYQQAMKDERFDKVIVATDDRRIEEACQSYGMEVMMTSEEHDTPTSRLYEVSTRIEGERFLLLMGDEPLMDERCFDLILNEEITHKYQVAALTNVLDTAAEVIDFSNQKVVCNSKREALLISRSPIPYPKGSLDIEYEKVTGVQIFSREALEMFNSTVRSVLEKAEENDLMRFIENDIKVKMIKSPYKTISVDTPKDLDEVRRIIHSNGV